MPPTLDAWLPVLRPHLASELVDDDALATIRSLMRHFPSDVMGVFEVRLAPGIHPVDFSVRLETLKQARQLASLMPLPHLRFLLESGWDQLGYPDPIESLWLEFDLDQPIPGPSDSSLPEPVLCARFSRPPDADWLIAHLFPALHGRALPKTQSALLLSCLRQIPDDWYLLYAFSLRARKKDAVRLELFGHNLESMNAYVRQVISKDAANRLETSSHLYEGCDRYHLSFDIGNKEISPRIGVEYAYAKIPKSEPRWRKLFDRLVEAGLCTPTKRDAVFKWPGYDTIWTAASRWPESGASRCLRSISHYKIVTRHTMTSESKIYLLMSVAQK